MSITQQYLGITQNTLGASYLDSKAVLNISENYNTGGSIESVNIGRFEVSDFSYSGANREQVTLNAEAPIARLSSNTIALPRNLPSHLVFFDHFNDPNEFSSNWTNEAGSWGVTNNSATVYTLSLPPAVLWSTLPDVEDFTITSKFAMSRVGSSAAFQIVFCAQAQQYSGIGSAYYRAVWAGNTITLDEVVDGSITNIAAAGALNGLSANVSVYLQVVKKEQNIYVQTSKDGVNFSTRLKALDTSFGFDTVFSRGSMGVIAYSTNGVTYTLDSIEIAEIGNQLDTKRATEQILALGSLCDTSIEQELYTFDRFQSSAGSSWVTGVTNNVVQADVYNSVTGNSWHLFTTLGSSFDDFVFSCDIRGTSGNLAGVLVGATNQFYVGGAKFGTGNSGFLVENYGSSRRVHTGRGIYMNLYSDTWYKLKLIKNNLSLRWYVNDVLANSLYGNSLLSDIGISNVIGLASLRAGASGTRTSFRNPEISRLDDLVETIEFNTNTPISSLIDRIVPEGFAINWSSNRVDVFAVGSSRGTEGISDYLIDSMESINNNVGVKMTLAGSRKTIARVVNSDVRTTKQIDSTRMSFIIDDSLDNTTEATKRAEANNIISNRAIQARSINIRTRPTIEQFDTVNLVDSRSGASGKFLISNLEKSFSAADGRFSQNIDLYPQE